MRCHHHILKAEQLVRGRRLGFKNIKRRSRHLAGNNRVIKRILDNQAAARAIDDAHALLAFGQRRRIDDVARLLGERRMQRDEIRALENIVKLHLLNADGNGPLRRQERIKGNHLHLEANGPVGHDGADIAAADDAERLVEKLNPHEAVLLPLARMGRGIGFGDLPRQRHHHGERMFRRGDGIAEGRVHHHDAARRSRRNIDIVHADAGPADHFQILGGFQISSA